MKHLKLLVSVFAVSFILLTGCQKETRTDNSTSASPTTKIGSVATTQLSAQQSADLRAKFNKFMASLPATTQERLKSNAKLALTQHPEYREMVRRALHVIEPTPCNANTAINVWLDKQLADWNDDVIYYVFATYMLDIPQDYAYVFENSSANQYFGTQGEYTHSVTKTFKDLKRFWNIQTSQIVLAAMHGSTLRDETKLIKIYMAYGFDAADAAWLADFVQQLLHAFPQYRNGDHPIFTFNAFAIKGFYFPPFGQIPDKIIMGDGIMEAYTALGYGDVAPQAILAHEFGHHIQFQLNLFTGEGTPEATRRTELMADAFSAYYLSHARGASMQWKRVKQFLAVFYNIGDCQFTSTGHHGTPTQRLAAAEWGYSIADNAQKQGHILTAQQFVALFEKQLPKLIAQ